MTKKTKLVALGVVSLVISITAVTAFFGYQLIKTPMGSDQTEIIFEVTPKTVLPQLAADLEAKGLIRQSQIFLGYVRLKKMSSKIKVEIGRAHV